MCSTQRGKGQVQNLEVHHTSWLLEFSEIVLHLQFACCSMGQKKKKHARAVLGLFEVKVEDGETSNV